jgi:hypothetical protein
MRVDRLCASAVVRAAGARRLRPAAERRRKSPTGFAMTAGAQLTLQTDVGFAPRAIVARPGHTQTAICAMRLPPPGNGAGVGYD